MKVVGASICAVRVYCCWVSEYQTLPELDAGANAVASAPQAITDLPIDIAPDIAPDAVPGAVTITLQSLPGVLPDQRVSLLVDDRELLAQSRTERPHTLVFQARGMPVGDYDIRPRVDGVDSLLVQDSAARAPQFDPTQ